MKTVSLCASLAILLALPAAAAFAAKPPTISGVSATNILADRATITWTTNVAADSQVEYGPTTQYGSSTPRDFALVTSHSVTVTGLNPNTTYNYRVKSSASPGGAQTASGNFTFKTKQLPALAYRVKFWNTPGALKDISHMNNLGQVTGPYIDDDGLVRSYIYDPVVNPDSALDVESIYPAPEGWRICRVAKISETGVMVGTLVPEGQVDTTPIRRGFYINTLDPQATATMLPNWGNWDYIYASDINAAGDIFGVYRAADGKTYGFVVNLNDLNDPVILPAPINSSAGAFAGYLNNPSGTRAAQVAGSLNDANLTLFRWTVGAGLETFPGALMVTGMNDAGTICGRTLTTGSNPYYPMLLKTTATPQLLKGAGPYTFAISINNTGDVLISDRVPYDGFLYRDDWATYGNYVNINKLVVFDSQQDRDDWTSAACLSWFIMNDRGAAGAGQIVGTWVASDHITARRFYLTPIAP